MGRHHGSTPLPVMCCCSLTNLFFDPERLDVERVANDTAQFGRGIAKADGQLKIAIFFNQPDPVAFGHVAVVFAQEGVT